MRNLLFLLALLAFGGIAHAQDEEPAPLADQATSRDPTQDLVPGRRVSADELKVQAQLPEALLKRDTRMFQNEVYKSIYNKELKPDQREDVDE